MTDVRELADDTGRRVRVPATVRRVVSIVPSLTESIGATEPALLVGATRWCTHPASLDVPRVGGTKNPDVERIVALRPDLVLANFEENRATDLDALRAAGVAVWVTLCTTLPAAFDSLTRVFAALGADVPDWLNAAHAAWRGVCPPRRRDVVVPIWRRPWMVLGHDTFAGDVLARLGYDNAYATHDERYPRVPLDELRGAAGMVVLPDEPYVFAADDGPESFPGLDVALVSGRHLTWYGPSLVDAPAVLAAQLSATVRRQHLRPED